MPTALKEWATTCDHLRRGQHTLLLRKGGIQEKRSGFILQHFDFFLYPTVFHQHRQLVTPPETSPTAPVTESTSVTIDLYAQVEQSWCVRELERLRALSGLHSLPWPMVEDRFHYRDKPYLDVLLVRIFRSRLTIIENRPEYAGCHSWVQLEEDIPLTGLKPVIKDSDFEQLHERVRGLLH